MKSPLLVSTVVAFLAGIILLTALQATGIVRIDALSNENVADASTQRVDLTSAAAPASLDNDRLNSIEASVASVNERLRQNVVQQDLLQAKINELESLRLQVQSLEASLEQQAQAVASGGEATGTAHATDTTTALLQETGANNRSQQRWGRGQFDSNEVYNNLLGSGIDPSIAEDIKLRSDQFTLQRLALIDQATREGWRESEEFDERINALRELRPDIRAELGDEDYDQYRFVSGLDNRVRIGSIIDGSNASLAGLQAGDLVVRYAGDRVFSMRELQSATQGGALGEVVSLEVQRAGQLVTLDLQRGPLGVTLQSDRVEPD